MTRTHHPLAVTALAILALSAASPALASDDGVAPFLAAQTDFERGLAGDGDATQRAHEKFRKLVEAEPTNPLYLAYLGSTTALLGRDAWAPWTKLRHTEKGLAFIDQAIALLGPYHDQLTVRGVPMSEEVRLNAAAAFLAAPAFLNRTEAARLALADALASPAFAVTPPPVQARLWVQASRLAQKDKRPADEADALKKALAASPDGSTAAEASARLKELGL